jgi:hypothetical protein
VKLYVNFFLPNLANFNDKTKIILQEIYASINLKVLESIEDIKTLFLFMLKQFEGALMDKD